MLVVTRRNLYRFQNLSLLDAVQRLLSEEKQGRRSGQIHLPSTVRFQMAAMTKDGEWRHKSVENLREWNLEHQSVKSLIQTNQMWPGLFHHCCSLAHSNSLQTLTYLNRPCKGAGEDLKLWLTQTLHPQDAASSA